jgi:hypothetical protein
MPGLSRDVGDADGLLPAAARPAPTQLISSNGIDVARLAGLFFLQRPTFSVAHSEQFLSIPPVTLILLHQFFAGRLVIDKIDEFRPADHELRQELGDTNCLKQQPRQQLKRLERVAGSAPGRRPAKEEERMQRDEFALGCELRRPEIHQQGACRRGAENQEPQEPAMVWDNSLLDNNRQRGHVRKDRRFAQGRRHCSSIMKEPCVTGVIDHSFWSDKILNCADAWLFVCV